MQNCPCNTIHQDVFVAVHESEFGQMAGVIVDAGVKMIHPNQKAMDGDQISHYSREYNDIWDENDRLVPEARPYSGSSAVLKMNHPLMIMVKQQRVVSIFILDIKMKLF